MGKILALAFLLFLYKFQTDQKVRLWYIFCAICVVLVALGWQSTPLSLLVLIGLFKVVKDLCQASSR